MSFAMHLSTAAVAFVLSLTAANAADQQTAAVSSDFSVLHQTRAVPLTAHELGAVSGSAWAVRVEQKGYAIVSLVPGQGPENSPHWTTSVYGGLDGIKVGPEATGGGL